MSQLQEVLSRENYDYVKSIYTDTELSQADLHERSGGKDFDRVTLEPDCPKFKSVPILTFSQSDPTSHDRTTPKRGLLIKSARSARLDASEAHNTSKREKPRLDRQKPTSPTSHQQNNESVAEQIRSFQQRPDLRECLLPGMLSGISPRACEGWQRKASFRSSHLLAKIKLEPCKKCQFALTAE
jgi:hypothetical protein